MGITTEVSEIIRNDELSNQEKDRELAKLGYTLGYRLTILALEMEILGF